MKSASWFSHRHSSASTSASFKGTTRSSCCLLIGALAAFLLVAVVPAASAAPPQLWQRCDADEPTGQQCVIPRGIAADSDNGHVFVADQSNHRIVEFNALGQFIKTWGWDVVASGPGNTGTGFEICVPQNADTCKAGTEGISAGQLTSPQGVAADSAGNVYVVDFRNQRVQKFNRAGEFLLAFGGDVVFGGPDDSTNNEEQELALAATAGSFRLGLPNILLDGGARQETAQLPFNASAAEVQAALNALPTIGGIGGSVSVSGSNPYSITFEGKLGGDDVPQLSVALDVGSQLKCSSPTAAETISYQWLRNGNAIEGATASTYTATEEDKGKSVQCQVIATNANAGSTQVAEPGQVIAPAPRKAPPSHPAPIAAPEASAPLNVGGGGQTLSCDADKAGWKDVPEGVFNYRWYRNGAQINGASSSTYQVTAADLGSPAVFQCAVIASGEFEGLNTVKLSENRATTPAPSAPPAPEAKASISPANNVVTVASGGGPEICKPTDQCKGGTEGAAPGQFGDWAVGSYIAIDSTDKVYVGDQNRIQRFDTGGVYQGEIALPDKTVQSLATDSTGNLYVVYANDISGVHKLSSAGVPLFPETFEIPKLVSFENPVATAVAVGAAGHVYVFGPTGSQVNSGATRDPILEFDVAGTLVDEFGEGEFDGSTGLAANLCAGSEAPGNLYVSNSNSARSLVRAYGTDPFGCFKASTGEASNFGDTAVTLNGTVNPDGAATSECRFQYGETDNYGTTVPCAESSGEIGEGIKPVPVHADISGLEEGTVYHFRLLAKVGSETETGADEEFKTLGPPGVSAEHLVLATDREATLKALVNPEGFATTYRFQYMTQAAFEADGFEGAQSTLTIAVGSDRTEHPVLANLTGLSPGTTYRWRVLATNSSGETESQAHAFATYRQTAPEMSCPNQALRTGASAFLPDCRAYEMVSPLDKNGGDIVSLEGGYFQAAPDGERITYTATPPFGDQANGFALNQYLASRQEGTGWSNHGIHPPVAGKAANSVIFGLTREFIAFSPGLCDAWLVDFQTPAPTADGQQGHENLYRRDNCGPGEGDLEALTPSPPALPEGTKEFYVSQTSVQGVSADSRHAVFVANAKLTPDASDALNATSQGSSPIAQVYDRFGGELSVLSVLPDSSAGDPSPGDGQGFAAPADSAVGSSWGNNLENAVSEDGSRVYWSFGFQGGAGGIGKIYLRQHPEQGIVVGECEAGNACTVPVSATADAFFWAGSRDGSKALFSEGNLLAGTADLYEFDLQRAEEAEPPRLLAEDITGVAGVSEDLSRVYFVSEAALPESGQNSEGDEAIGGEPNLYLAEGGAFSFLGTLVEGDVGTLEPGAVFYAYMLDANQSSLRATRVSADGAQIAFESRAPLTDYDNTDAASGKPAVEVYLYDADSGRLICASCNPSGARPSSGRELKQSFNQDDQRLTNVIAAAWIPTWQHPLHASNVLSKDGGRLFFNSHDALLTRDTNGAQDVYEWEAPGVGGCTEASPSYFPQNGGCLYLISSGENGYRSEFWEADTNGSDVFFTTEASLLPRDPGLIDLYDARIGGGFVEPTPKAACEGEACQAPVSPPNDPTPASSSFRGPDSTTKGVRKRCPKGKRQVRRGGKARCLTRNQGEKQKRQRQKQANHSRRAAR